MEDDLRWLAKPHRVRVQLPRGHGVPPCRWSLPTGYLKKFIIPLRVRVHLLGYCCDQRHWWSLPVCCLERVTLPDRRRVHLPGRHSVPPCTWTLPVRCLRALTVLRGCGFTGWGDDVACCAGCHCQCRLRWLAVPHRVRVQLPRGHNIPACRRSLPVGCLKKLTIPLSVHVHLLRKCTVIPHWWSLPVW